MQFNTNVIVIHSVTVSSITLPQIIQDTLYRTFILNLNTNSNLIHYGVISTSEYSGLFKTLVGFPDRSIYQRVTIK